MNNSNQRLSAGVIAAAVLLLVAACGEPKSPQQVDKNVAEQQRDAAKDMAETKHDAMKDVNDARKDAEQKIQNAKFQTALKHVETWVSQGCPG